MTGRISLHGDAMSDEEVHENAYGLSLNALFFTVADFNKGRTLQEVKEEFYALLRRWLAKETIRFRPPGKLHAGFWDEKPDAMIDHFERHWPRHVKCRKDYDLEIYLYNMPWLLWRTPSGDWFGS